MADFTQIINKINADINTNGVGAITGAKLNEVLRDMIAAVNAEKQDPLTIDATPTEDSTNPVQSGGVYSALLEKATRFYTPDITDIPPTILNRLKVGDIVSYGNDSTASVTVAVIDEQNDIIILAYNDGMEVGGYQYQNGICTDTALFSLSDMANKVSEAANGHLAGLDSEGNLTDSGIAASDVATASDLAGKQDVISDLATIRSGAAAGATAYQKPSTGIPKTDLASGVQTSLGKADTAVQQVTVGTTTTGNAGTNASVTNSGTSTAPVLDFTIPRGADGADGQDGADAVNPFKGWWPDLAALKAAHTATAGDSAYVKDASPATTWSIYIYDSTASSNNYWADSGTNADTSNVQTFASGEEVNEVHIVNDCNTGGVDDVLSAEQGKVLNVYSDVTNTIDGRTLSTLEKGAIGADGNLSTNSSYRRRTITNDNYIRISGTASGYKDFLIIAFYNGTPSSSTLISNKGVVCSTSYIDQSYDVEIPAGTAYIVVVNYTREENTNPATCYLLQQEVTTVKEKIASINNNVENLIPPVEKYLCDSKEFDSVLDGYALNTSGVAVTNLYVTQQGVTGFINIEGVSYIKILGNCHQGDPSRYTFCGFYSDTSENSFLSCAKTTQGSVENYIINDIPNAAAYARFVIENYNEPLELEMTNAIDSITNRVITLESKNNVVLLPQINSNCFLKKTITEEVNILLIGSSWGVDTISALADICNNVGVPVNTGNMYKSGGSIAQYLDDIDNSGTNSFYYNHGGTNESLGNKTVLQALQYKDWDVIILMEGASNSVVVKDGYNKDFVKWLKYIKMNCTNPNVVFALDSTWTEKTQQGLQQQAFYILYDLMKQSGIDIIIPVASSIIALRRTAVNNGNDIYRDSLHLDEGVGRFTAACALYYAIVYPVYGVGLDNCTITGYWNQAAGSVTYTTIEVSDNNRSICIDCAKQGNANIFNLPIE